MPLTGNGTTITFGTSGFSAEIVGATPPGEKGAVINTSHLGTTVAHTKMPGDLLDITPMKLRVHFAPGVAPTVNGAAETVTIDFPDTSQWHWSGWISEATPGELVNDDKVESDIVVECSGAITKHGVGSATGSGTGSGTGS